MQRAFIVLTLALVLAVAAGTRAAAAQTPVVTVTPGAGSQFQTFTFRGQYFIPGTVLDQKFVSPDGEEIVPALDGAPATITVDANGRFVVVVVPAVDFAGGSPGVWRVSFCVQGNSEECWVQRIRISL